MKSQIAASFYSIFFTSILLLFTYISYSQWTQTYSEIYGDSSFEQLGSSVCLSADGMSLIAGAPHDSFNGNQSGSAQVYERQGNVWVEKGNTIYGLDGSAVAGTSVCINSDGTIIGVTAPGQFLPGVSGDTRGNLSMYQYVNGSWILMGEVIYDLNPGSSLSSSLSMSDDGLIVAVGNPNFDSGDGGWQSSVGMARVYQFIDDSWEQMGNTIVGEQASSFAGRSLSLSSDGMTLAVGATGSSNSVLGYTNVYEFTDNDWQITGNTISASALGDYFGTSVSLNNNGSILAVGARYDSSVLNNAGSVTIYLMQGGNWVQYGQTIFGEGPQSNLGASVSLNGEGNRLAIGVPQSNVVSLERVEVYEYNSGMSEWTLMADPAMGLIGEKFGESVSLSDDGKLFAAGGPDGQQNGTDSGTIRTYGNCNPSVVFYSVTDANDGANGSIDINVGGDGDTFLFDWSNDEAGDFDDPEDLANIPSGNYMLTVMNEVGCTTSYSIDVGEMSSHIDDNEAFSFQVNSSFENGFIAITTNQLFSGDVKLIDTNGKLFSSKTVNGTNFFELDVSDVNPGLYVLILKSKDRAYSEGFVLRP